MNHACDANVRFSSTERDGRGCFIARRDVAVGESLCTNYIGEMTDVMSTPLGVMLSSASKLFTCQCAKCRTAADPLRHVPCPAAIRARVECSLPASIAAGRRCIMRIRCPQNQVHSGCVTTVRRVAAHGRLRMSWSGRAPGGLTGRPWEVVLERNVLHFDAKHSRCCAWLGAALVEQAEGLHEAVSRSVGSRHWTTRRLAEILEEPVRTPRSAHHIRGEVSVCVCVCVLVNCDCPNQFFMLRGRLGASLGLVSATATATIAFKLPVAVHEAGPLSLVRTLPMGDSCATTAILGPLTRRMQGSSCSASAPSHHGPQTRARRILVRRN